MANDKKFVVKNGLQTSNVNFIDSDANNVIVVSMLTSDTLSISGNSGQLFSITDSMSNTIFAVNDISGTPSIEVYANGDIRLAELTGNVSIGSSNSSYRLYVNGTAFFSGNVAVGNTTMSRLIVNSQNADANSAILPVDINGAWMRIGDGTGGGLTMANGVGVKFHDAGSNHMSVGMIGTTFYISDTSVNGDTLFPSTRTDLLSISSSTTTLSKNVAMTGTLHTISGNVNVDSGLLFVDGTNNRVGINNTAPGHALSVNGAAFFNSTANVSSTLAAGNTTITGFANVSSTLQVTGTSTLTGNATLSGALQTISGNVNVDSGVLFVDATNNRVGVNNTAPGHALSVNGTTFFNNSAFLTTTGTTDAWFYISRNANTTAGSYGGTIYQALGFNRWSQYVFGNETGSNAGSDFFISRYTDAGSYVDNPLFIARNTGRITAANGISVTTGSITVAGSTVWHAGNDGSGSGLDADLLDGYNIGTSGGTIPLLNGVNTFSGNLTFTGENITSNTAPSFQYFETDAATDEKRWRTYMEGGIYAMVGLNDAVSDSRTIFSIDRGGYTAFTWDFGSAVTLTKNGSTIWHAGNDGAGSGLDADLLDGYQAANFAILANIGQRFNTTTGMDLSTGGSYSGAFGALEIFQATAGTDALLTFHVGSDFAGHFGIDGGINDFVVGGWSYGSNTSYRLWHAGNDGAGSGLDADLLDGYNVGTSGGAIPLLNGTHTWSGINTFTSGIVINNTAPYYEWYESDAATDQKRWRLLVENSYLSLKLTNDAYNSEQTVLSFTRSGTTPGTTYWYSGLSLQTTIPFIDLYETDAATNAKWWRVVADGGALFYGALTDAGSQNTYMRIDRSGNSITSVTIQNGPLQHRSSEGETPSRISSESNGDSFFITGPNRTTQNFYIGPDYNFDKLVSLYYSPGTVGANAGVLKIGQNTKNNANFTHGETHILSRGLVTSSFLQNQQTFYISGYQDGRYMHRFLKQDDGGGVPLYIQKTDATAGSWTTIASFGGSNSRANFQVDGIGLATTDWRAPLFRDSDNTAYYVDPAGTSVMSSIALGGQTSAPQGMIWGAGDIWMNGDNRFVGFSTDGSGDGTPNVTLKGSGNDFVVQNWSGAVNEENLRVVGATRRVGIGTSSPSYRLHVNEATLGTTQGDTKLMMRLETSTSNADYLNFFKVRTSNGSDWDTAGWRLQQLVDVTWHGYIQFNGGNNEGLSFGTGASSVGPLSIAERLRINNQGTVLINTINPTTSTSSKLVVNGDLTLAGANRALLGNLYYDTGWKYAANGYGWGFREDNSGKLQFTTAPNNSSGAAAVASPSFTLTTWDIVNSRVGIGTASPGYTLDVNGTLAVATNIRTPIFYDSNDTAYYLNPAGESRIWRTQIFATASTAGADSYTAELYSPDTGDNTKQVSLRFHQGAQYYFQIRANNQGFRFTEGGTNNLTTIAAGNINYGGTLTYTGSASGQAIDLALNDGYASMRVIGNYKASSPFNDGLWIGYNNSNSGQTRIYGGGAATNPLIKYSNYTVEPVDFRAPIFYDNDNTAYYLNPASTSHILNLSFGGTPSSILKSAAQRLDIANVGGLDANSPFWLGYHWSPPDVLTNSSAANSFPRVSFYFNYSTVTNPTNFAWNMILGNLNSIPCAFNIGNDSGGDIALVTSGATRLFINTAGNITTYVDMRSPIFYDSNNTAYYLDPASTSQVYSMVFNNPASTKFGDPYFEWRRANSTRNGYIQFTDSGGIVIDNELGDYTYLYGNTNCQLEVRADNGHSVLSLISSGTNSSYILLRNVTNDERFRLYADNGRTLYMSGNNGSTNHFSFDSSGVGSAVDSWRAPTFYVSSDTNNRFYAGGLVLRSNSPTVFLQDTDHNSAMLHCNSNLLYVLRGGNDTTGWTQVNGQWPFVFNLTNNDATCGGTLAAVTDVRAPLFRDSNDTSYYIDAASTSILNGLTLGGLLIGRNSTSASTDVNTANDSGSLSLRGNTSTVASMSFHRTGAYAVNMGLGTDGVIRIGGWSAANNCLQLDGSGNLTTLANITAYSDAKLKKDVETIENAVDLVCKMRGVKYTRIDTEKRGVGVIAQEMLEVLPEVVQQGIGDDTTLSVAYGNIVGVLIEAIKEQQEQINRLEQMIKEKI